MISVLSRWGLPISLTPPAIPSTLMRKGVWEFGYIYLTMFREDSLYLGMRSGPYDPTYPGSGTSPRFQAALDLTSREPAIQAVLGVFSRRPGICSLRKMEVVMLSMVGLPNPSEPPNEEPPWLNRWAHNGGPRNANSASQARFGSIGGRSIGGMTLLRQSTGYLLDSSLRDRIEAGHSLRGSYWLERFPNLPTMVTPFSRGMPSILPHADLAIVPRSRPQFLNPFCRRGELVYLALTSTSIAEYARGYEPYAIPKEKSYRESLSSMWRSGVIGLRCQRSGELVEIDYAQRKPRGPWNPIVDQS